MKTSAYIILVLPLCCLASPIRLKPGLPLLFVDDSCLERRSGAVFIVHQGVEDDKPVLVDTEPWERDAKGRGQVCIYGSVYPKEDGSGYRMWYNCFARVLLAESTDGVNWTKPILNVCEMQGSTSNNVVIPRLSSPTILRDSFEKDPSRRYKAVGSHYYKPGHPKQGYYTMTSPDGIHWDMSKEQKIASWWDTCTMSQNPHTGEYLVYHKRELQDNGYSRRTVYLTKSMDFVKWTEPVRTFGADEVDDMMWRDDPRQVTDIYNMGVTGHAGGFIGIPSIFRIGRYIPQSEVDKSRYMSAHDGPLFLGFVTSQDGESWKQPPGRRPILPSRAYGVYNSCHPGCSSGGAFLHVGDETWLYTYCTSHGHGTGYPADWKPGKYIPQWSIGRAVWRRWGFMSLESRSGVVVTKPLVFEGPEVVLNAKGEKVKVCAKDLSGKIRGIAKFSGDSTREVLKWDRPLPTGTPVRLQFELTHAALYSIEVKR